MDKVKMGRILASIENLFRDVQPSERVCRRIHPASPTQGHEENICGPVSSGRMNYLGDGTGRMKVTTTVEGYQIHLLLHICYTGLYGSS